mmetsp:Transcript_26452/g.49595  ORF Transcript_26452/g.49595 Transcript_26452/m.49595 type:complete len:94 (+) Transcript_26452:576-857(+)
MTPSFIIQRGVDRDSGRYRLNRLNKVLYHPAHKLSSYLSVKYDSMPQHHAMNHRLAPSCRTQRIHDVAHVRIVGLHTRYHIHFDQCLYGSPPL